MSRIATTALLVLAAAAATLSGCAHTPAPASATAPASAPAVGRNHEARVLFGSCAKPVYPAQSFAAQDQGTVVMEFLISTDGSVVDSKVLKSSGHAALDETARKGIAQCKFNPAMEDGKVVQQWTTVSYVWTLK
jgi:bla regulator protein blaR1